MIDGDLTVTSFQPAAASLPVKRRHPRSSHRQAPLCSRQKELQGFLKKAKKRNQRLKMANARKTSGIRQAKLHGDKVKRAMNTVRSRVSSRFFQLLAAEARNHGVSPRGRRWLIDETLTALAMYHRGRRLYTSTSAIHISLYHRHQLWGCFSEKCCSSLDSTPRSSQLSRRRRKRSRGTTSCLCGTK